MSEEQKIDDPPSHRILWTVCDITIFLYALIHVVLTFFIAWFTRSSSWALIFCFSSLIILIGLATVPCCCLSRTKADKLHRVLTSVLILASYIVIGICGSLLGWGAAGYSEYSSMKIAYDVTLDPSITDPAIFNISSKYSAFYFKGNNSFVFSMAGKYFLCGSCASYAGCCQWLHVVPVIMGNDPGGWVTKKLSVPLWISTISYEVDPFYAFGGSPFFGNSAVRNWNDQARFSDIYSNSLIYPL